MLRQYSRWLLLLLGFPQKGVWAESEDYSRHVNVFMGTEGGGNNFPGVSRPYGMVKLGPDLLIDGVDSYSGYLADGNFSGFSMMHQQGTGGAPKYGTVAQLPLLGDISNPLSNITIGRAVPDQGSLGYYRSQTSENVIVEMAATERAGFYQYTFPSGSSQKNILIDVTHVLPSFRNQGLGQEYAGGSFELFDDHFEASGVYNNGWNRAPNWTIYSCGYFNVTPVRSAVYTGRAAAQSVAEASRSVRATTKDKYIGAMFTFDQAVFSSRVGISWISAKQACQNVNDQIPDGTEFGSVVEGTRRIWNTEVLSKVTTTTKNATNLQLLYSSLYFMNLIPTNQTGENPGWNSSEPYYSDTFTLWDTFRCTTALSHILQPVQYEEYLRSLIDIWRHDDYLPDARSSNYNGRVQGGTNADNVLADAYVKGVRGAVNWDDGYAAMVKDAEMTPPNDNPDPMSSEASTKEGRGALPDWIELGFITPKYYRSVSRAVDYAYNDFALHQVAKGLGKAEDAEKYLNRSRNWRNHWNPNKSSLGFEGFMVPRSLEGFEETNSLRDSGYWHGRYYQATSYAYSFGDIHDMKTLVEWMGGYDAYFARLDAMFTVGADPENSKGIMFDSTNEPSFNIPYLYNFVNQQHRSVHQARGVAKRDYNIGPRGIPGNSDAGAMQTWLLWNMIGLYPVTGQTTFLIHSPWFEEITLDMSNGKNFTVKSTGGDGKGDTDYYVQSLKVNGKDWNKNWVTWEDVFENGGTMEFMLGPKPIRWDIGDLPPSPASETVA